MARTDNITVRIPTPMWRRVDGLRRKESDMLMAHASVAKAVRIMVLEALSDGAAPRLSPMDMKMLSEVGETKRVRIGDDLWRLVDRRRKENSNIKTGTASRTRTFRTLLMRSIVRRERRGRGRSR